MDLQSAELLVMLPLDVAERIASVPFHLLLSQVIPVGSDS